jgi:hypothetical protein
MVSFRSPADVAGKFVFSPNCGSALVRSRCAGRSQGGRVFAGRCALEACGLQCSQLRQKFAGVLEDCLYSLARSEVGRAVGDEVADLD